MRPRASCSTLAALTLVFAGPALAAPPGTRIPKRAGQQAKATAAAAKRRAAALRRFANTWRGTPYLWGGHSRTGIDCSAYLRQMFRETFDVELPRTTKGQIHIGMGININPARLGEGFQPGDLFFYVDAGGVPNHVVTYLGDGQFSHSASGRGVVVEGFRALWGRRIVGRRVLVPATGSGPAGAYGAIPASPGSVEPISIPCPPSVRARRDHVRRFMSEALTDFAGTGLTEICEWRALAGALNRRRGPQSEANRARIEEHVVWLQSIEALKGEIDQSWR